MGDLKDKDLKAALERDPVAELHGMLGFEYYNTTPREKLAYMEFVGDQKTKLLQETGDTLHSNRLGDYIKIAESIGFQKVLELPFAGQDGGTDKYFMFWRKDGILLEFDTYWNGRDVNSGHFYYNWLANSDDYPGGVTSSGQHFGNIMAGYHDCREGLKFHIRQLEKYGTFLPKWKHRPWLWLLTYMDEKVKPLDRDAFNEKYIAMLPAEVREAIRGEA